MRWALLIVGVALLRADDARACTPPDTGVQGFTVLPEDGATAVPLNARIVVEYDTAGADLGNTITLRVQGGADVAATTSAPVTLGYGRMLVPDAPLAGSTTFEVLDDLIVGCDPNQTACIGTPIVIATFTTGDAVDTIAPSLSGVTIRSEMFCAGGSCPDTDDDAATEITVDHVVDDGPSSWVRYEYFDADGVLLAGPTSWRNIGEVCSQGYFPYARFIPIGSDAILRGVDLAGNVEATPHPIDGAGCESCDPINGVDAGNATSSDSAGCGCSSTDPRGGALLIAALALSRALSRRP